MAEGTQLELVLLDLVRQGRGTWGWYQIETKLSRIEVPRAPNAIAILKEMAQRGLVMRYVEPGSPNDRWELTPDGASLLESKKADFDPK